MRIYQLTDRDFEEFYLLIQKVETENRLEHGHANPTSPCKECSLMSTYRFCLIGWRNRLMSGDTYDRSIEPTRDDIQIRIRAEIKRLTNLLPED